MSKWCPDLGVAEAELREFLVRLRFRRLRWSRSINARADVVFRVRISAIMTRKVEPSCQMLVPASVPLFCSTDEIRSGCRFNNLPHKSSNAKSSTTTPRQGRERPHRWPELTGQIPRLHSEGSFPALGGVYACRVNTGQTPETCRTTAVIAPRILPQIDRKARRRFSSLAYVEHP